MRRLGALPLLLDARMRHLVERLSRALVRLPLGALSGPAIEPVIVVRAFCACRDLAGGNALQGLRCMPLGVHVDAGSSDEQQRSVVGEVDDIAALDVTAISIVDLLPA